MPAFNFKKQFVPAIESGEKRQTIRAPRKCIPVVGQIAHCYTGQRTKPCRLLGRWPITDVLMVLIHAGGVAFPGSNSVPLMKWQELNTFAEADGFEDWSAMREWFRKTHGPVFRGYLVKWAWKAAK